jgi:hypothetical protein
LETRVGDEGPRRRQRRLSLDTRASRSRLIRDLAIREAEAERTSASAALRRSNAR